MQVQKYPFETVTSTTSSLTGIQKRQQGIDSSLFQLESKSKYSYTLQWLLTQGQVAESEGLLFMPIFSRGMMSVWFQKLVKKSNKGNFYAFCNLFQGHSAPIKKIALFVRYKSLTIK